MKLYTNSACSGSPAATGTPAQFSGAGITVAVPANATTQLAARTSDASGNDSSCSGSFPYTEDSTGPAAPAITDTDPDSPSSDNNPEVKGTTGAGSPTTVKLYTNASCTGSPAATGTPTQFAGAGITVAVPANLTTQLAARTSDASGNDSTCSAAFPYTEDSTGAAAPAITDTDPDSPSSDNNPEVKGTTGAGSPTTVKLYTNSSCSGSPAATGTPTQFAGAGITVAVPANATTQLAARTSDASGNDSTCSSAFPYVEDSTAPATPAITDTDPDSPSSDNNPEVKGTTGSGSPTAVELYANGSCSGSPVATGTPTQFGGAGITVAVPANAVTQLSALATDAAGNDSSCSGSFSYTEDSTAPAAPAITDTDPDSPSGDNNPEVKGTTGAGSPTAVEIYTNASCSGSPAATGTPTQFAGTGITVAVPANATTQLSALATDASGNDSSCSGPFSYTEDSTGPAAPAITDTDPDSPSSDNEPRGEGHDRRRIPDRGGGLHERIVLRLSGGDRNAGSVRGAGITVAVPANATTQLTARTSDASGNDSDCSSPFSYTEDSTGAAAPAITDTDPDSPSSDNNPEVKGTTGAGSPTAVEIYTNSSCSGSPAATGTPTQFAGAGITVGVPANATTQLAARTSDASGNDSDLFLRVPLRRGLDSPGGPRDHRHRPGFPIGRQQPRGPGNDRRRLPDRGDLVRERFMHGLARRDGDAGTVRGRGDHGRGAGERDDPTCRPDRGRRWKRVGMLGGVRVRRGLHGSHRARDHRHRPGLPGQRQRSLRQGYGRARLDRPALRVR